MSRDIKGYRLVRRFLVIKYANTQPVVTIEQYVQDMKNRLRYLLVDVSCALVLALHFHINFTATTATMHSFTFDVDVDFNFTFSVSSVSVEAGR